MWPGGKPQQTSDSSHAGVPVILLDVDGLVWFLTLQTGETCPNIYQGGAQS